MQRIRQASSLDLLIPALAGFSASLFLPGLYYTVFVGHNHELPTSHQTVCMYALSALAGFLTIQFFDVTQGRNLLKRRKVLTGLLTGILGAVTIIPLVLVATEIVQLLMHRFGAAAPEEHELLIVFQQNSIIDRLLVVLSAVVLAPLFEELTFRAHLQAAIRRATSLSWLAICVASALFAAVHGILWMMPPLFVLAVGLGFVYDRTKNIWACIVIHASFNALSLTVEYFSMKHH